MVEKHFVKQPPRPSGRLGRVVRGLELVEAACGAFFLLLILVLVMIQVVVRFTPFGGWVWTGEVARFALVWMTFILSGYLLGRRQHISLDMIDHALSARGRRVVGVLSHLVVLAVCVAFVYDGLGLLESQAGISSPAANIQMPLVYVLPLAGFLLTLLRAVLGLATKDRA